MLNLNRYRRQPGVGLSRWQYFYCLADWRCWLADGWQNLCSQENACLSKSRTLFRTHHNYPALQRHRQSRLRNWNTNFQRTTRSMHALPRSRAKSIPNAMQADAQFQLLRYAMLTLWLRAILHGTGIVFARAAEIAWPGSSLTPPDCEPGIF